MFQPERLADSRQFLMIQFHDGGELHRVGKNFRAVEILPKIDVENPHRAGASRLQKIADGRAASRRALGKRSETYRIGLRGEDLPLRRPLEKLPGHRLADLKA